MEENTNLEVVKSENQGMIKGLGQLGSRSKTECEIFTNITDEKKIFNLENKVDHLLNDCENEMIRVKEVLIKIYRKPLENPEIDEQTGEIIKDTEFTMSTVLVDDNGESYATGSKMFAIQLMRYIEAFGLKDEGVEIKITKTKLKDTGNKKLGFELV